MNLDFVSQCLQIYGPADFEQAYTYLREARSVSGGVDEAAMVAGLGRLVSNLRDCFLVDQLVFLEKQAECSNVLP